MQMSRDSVTLRENPCSSKNIRIIRQIRTEQITNTEKHGNTRMQMSKNIRNIRKIRTEQKPLNFQHNEKVRKTNPPDIAHRLGNWFLGDADLLQRHPHRHHDLQQRQTR